MIKTLRTIMFFEAIDHIFIIKINIFPSLLSFYIVAVTIIIQHKTFFSQQTIDIT